jgi:hypothetical protein
MLLPADPSTKTVVVDGSGKRQVGPAKRKRPATRDESKTARDLKS